MAGAAAGAEDSGVIVGAGVSSVVSMSAFRHPVSWDETAMCPACGARLLPKWSARALRLALCQCGSYPHPSENVKMSLCHKFTVAVSPACHV